MVVKTKFLLSITPAQLVVHPPDLSTPLPGLLPQWQYQGEGHLGFLSATYLVKEEQEFASVTRGDPMCLLQWLSVMAQQLRDCRSLS